LDRREDLPGFHQRSWPELRHCPHFLSVHRHCFPALNPDGYAICIRSFKVKSQGFQALGGCGLMVVRRHTVVDVTAKEPQLPVGASDLDFLLQTSDIGIWTVLHTVDQGGTCKVKFSAPVWNVGAAPFSA
jgi:hypothetical protein